MPVVPRILSVAAFTLAAFAAPAAMHAQSLALEGETGGFIVPAAYTVPSEPGHAFAAPTIGFHYVGNGPVIGDFYISSITSGYKNFLEFGYTRNSHSNGSDNNLGKLWQFNGFNTFHAKVKIVSENRNGHMWVPAIAIGGIVRSQDYFVTGALAQPTHQPQTNGDIYLAATKLVTQTKIPLLLDAGIRGTNGQLFGGGGNASSSGISANPLVGAQRDQSFSARGFAGIGIPLPLKRSSPRSIIVDPGAEISQQPTYTQYAAGTHLPSTESYGLRFTQLPSFRWTLDVGVGHIGNTLAGGTGDIAAAQLHANTVRSISLSYRLK